MPAFFYPLLGRTRFRGRSWQPFGCLIVQNRQAVQYIGKSMDGHWRTTWSTVCSFVPQSQAAEEVIPHLYRQEWKRPTPVRRRLSRMQAVLGRVIPGGWERCLESKSRVLWGCPSNLHFDGDPHTAQHVCCCCPMN